jgi:arylsulfatase A-like enzyme
MTELIDGGATGALVCEPTTTNEPTAGAVVSRGRPESRRLWSDVLLTAAWLALVSGGFEAVYWLVRQRLGGEMVFMHPGFVWMSPLTQVAFFALPGAALAVIAWRNKSPSVLPFAATALSLIAWLNVLELLVPGLYFWAWVLLGCGLATVTGRLLQRYTVKCLWVVRRTTPGMLVLVLLAAVGQTWLAGERERRAVAALPEAPEDAPNILLIVLDTARADSVGLYSADREDAPHLAELAGRGAVFEAATATAPWTLPSQAGMFTGRLPHELSASWLHKLDATHPTLAEQLSRRGWLTGGFVGNTRYCSAETGLARGFTRYEGYRLSWADFLMCTALGRKVLVSRLPAQFGMLDWPGRKRAPEINKAFLNWLDHRQGRPYFAFLNYWDLHDPYVAPPAFQSHPPSGLHEKLLLRNWWWVPKEGLSPDHVEMLRDNYRDCMRGLDHQLGKLFEQLEERGELENTFVIITADHGEHFGEHDLFLHGNSLYEPLLHVPLVVIWPEGIPAGARVEQPVSLRGLPNTVLELVGEQAAFPGKSWVGRWSAGAADAGQPQPIVAEIASQAGFPPCHGHSPVAAGSMQSVRLGNMKLIRNGDGSQELYDLATDPDELTNLAGLAQYAPQLSRLRSLLHASSEVSRQEASSSQTADD